MSAIDVVDGASSRRRLREVRVGIVDHLGQSHEYRRISWISPGTVPGSASTPPRRSSFGSNFGRARCWRFFMALPLALWAWNLRDMPLWVRELAKLGHQIQLNAAEKDVEASSGRIWYPTERASIAPFRLADRLSISGIISLLRGSSAAPSAPSRLRSRPMPRLSHLRAFSSSKRSSAMIHLSINPIIVSSP